MRSACSKAWFRLKTHHATKMASCIEPDMLAAVGRFRTCITRCAPEDPGTDHSTCMPAMGRADGHRDCVSYRQARHHRPLCAHRVELCAVAVPQAVAELGICDCEGSLHARVAVPPARLAISRLVKWRPTSTPVQLRPTTTAIANAAIVITMTIVADWPGVLVPAGELCGIPALCYLVFRRPGATAPARVRMRTLSDLIRPGPFGRHAGRAGPTEYTEDAAVLAALPSQPMTL